VLNTPEYAALKANSNCFAFNEMFPGGYTPKFGGNIVDTAMTVGTRGDIHGGFLDEATYDLSGCLLIRSFFDKSIVIW
jgi:iron complex outermembrane receptor protein